MVGLAASGSLVVFILDLFNFWRGGPGIEGRRLRRVRGEGARKEEEIRGERDKRERDKRRREWRKWLMDSDDGK